MSILRAGWWLFVAALIVDAGAPAFAAEGPSLAGPIGGTDVRSATLPPPGFYVGAVALWADAFNFVDGQGNPIPVLKDARLARITGGPLAIFVPNIDLFGGSVGLSAFLPMGRQCGRLFTGASRVCQSGLGDPYIETTWSRGFGQLRPSRDPGALPIFEGLTVALASGVVVPIGQYNATDATTKALSNGTHIWVFAPSLAATYTTPPFILEGTELSAKFYWNNYLVNPATQYLTGTILDTDFALTERFERFQFGVAGFFVAQVADDKLNGVPVPPDGVRARNLELGGVLVYDMPTIEAALRFKGLTTVAVANSVHSNGFVVSLFKKIP